MAIRVIATGVTIHRSPDPWPRPEAGRTVVQVRAFVELERDGVFERREGSALDRSITVASDPTTDLLHAADEVRYEAGDIFGDLRIAGEDVTRFEFRAAPFRIELSDEVREALRGSWKEREPR
jgi:hypothetical protein